MQNLRATSNLDKYEYRASRYGAFDVFAQQTNDPNGIITEDLRTKARTSIGRTLETPVIDYDGDVTIGNQRTLTIGDSENTSRMVQFTFATYTFGFTIVPSLYMNNESNLQRDFNTKMMKYIYKLAQKLDTVALAALAAKKTQVINNGLIYDTSDNAVNGKWTERENILGDLGVIMGANDYYGQLHIVADPGVESMLRKLQQKGLYNEVNKQNEYMDKIVHFSNNIPATEGKYAQGYAVQAGSLGILDRFERECLLGSRSRDGHEWGIAKLPLLNINCGTYFYDSVGDYSTIAGDASADMDRVRKEHYGFAVDLAFVTPYNSNPAKIASPILAFNISSEDAVYAKPVYVVNKA
jgi:hypothetical protein